MLFKVIFQSFEIMDIYSFFMGCLNFTLEMDVIPSIFIVITDLFLHIV